MSSPYHKQFTNPKTPDWFDLSKYEKAETLNAKEWNALFVERMTSFYFFMLFDYISTPESRDNSENLNNSLSKVQELKNFMGSFKGDTVNPLHLYDDPIGEIWLKNFEYDTREIVEAVFEPDVEFTLLTVNAAFRKCSQEEEMLKTVELMVNGNHYPNNNLKFNSNSENSELYHPHRILAIDLTAPESVIKKEFNVMLKKLKQEHSPQSGTFEAAKRSLINARVLQFIDLYSYFYWNDIEVKNTELAHIIFPDAYDYDPVDKLRRTTIPKVKKIMDGNSGFLSWLEFYSKT